MNLFSLQKYIRVRPIYFDLEPFSTCLQEEAFAHEFLDHNGLVGLVDVIFSATGNTLAVIDSYHPFQTETYLGLVCIGCHAEFDGIGLRVGGFEQRVYIESSSNSILAAILDQRLSPCYCHPQETCRSRPFQPSGPTIGEF
jgi:hypothetical protein